MFIRLHHMAVGTRRRRAATWWRRLSTPMTTLPPPLDETRNWELQQALLTPHVMRPPYRLIIKTRQPAGMVDGSWCARLDCYVPAVNPIHYSRYKWVSVCGVCCPFSDALFLLCSFELMRHTC